MVSLATVSSCLLLPIIYFTYQNRIAATLQVPELVLIVCQRIGIVGRSGKWSAMWYLHQE